MEHAKLRQKEQVREARKLAARQSDAINIENDDMDDDCQQDRNSPDSLLVDQAHLPPMMTERRVARLANQYPDDLYKLAEAEDVNDVSIAVKNALQKVKAGNCDQLNA